MTVAGQRILITGGGSGIGRATALALARLGATVAILDCNMEQLRKTASEIAEIGLAPLVLVGDIRFEEQVKEAARTVQGQWGRLDGLFSNAGINGIWAPLDQIEAEEWDATFNVNLRGTFLVLKYFIPQLKVTGGSIVITSSTVGNFVFSNLGSTAYGCTKAALVSLGKQLALELAEHHIRVNVVCPGPIGTTIAQTTSRRGLESCRIAAKLANGYPPLTDGVAGAPEDVAEVVTFLMGNGARFITGAEIVIDGGNFLIKG
ncbi:MAG: SDR family oxidoreductase [Lentisphaerae bacterium]|nr:MAG: SDR family oxidoreductase [Lentisphaerota bacterium]